MPAPHDWPSKLVSQHKKRSLERDGLKIRLMMAEMAEIQTRYESGTAPFRWINQCIYNLDGAFCAISHQEKSTDA